MNRSDMRSSLFRPLCRSNGSLSVALSNISRRAVCAAFAGSIVKSLGVSGATASTDVQRQRPAMYSGNIVSAGDAKRQLALYVRKENDRALSKVYVAADGEVSDLARIIKAELQIQELPSNITIRKQEEQHKPGPLLDNKMTLEKAGVKDRDKLVVSVEIRPSLPPLPDPIVRSPIMLEGESWFKADLFLEGATAPIFLNSDQHKELLRFIEERPSRRPQLLMLVGAAKSGKSTLLHEVLPGMVAARASSSDWPADRPRPVIFRYKFPLMADAEKAVVHLCDALIRFGRQINVPFQAERDGRAALNNLPINLEEFSRLISEGGGELWLLLDEMHAPIFNSSFGMAEDFTYMFKDIVENCSSLTRIAVTGSSLTLMNAFRKARVNSYALWDAASYLSLGSTPKRPVAEQIATAIHTAYTSRWPPDIKAAISAKALVDKLSSTAAADDSLTSPRPALLAYTLECMGGEGRRDSRAGDNTLVDALDKVRRSILTKAGVDTVSALAEMGDQERQILRAVADGQYSYDELRAIKDGHIIVCSAQFAEFIEHLSELGSGSAAVRLQPPYQALLRSWICEDGDLAVELNATRKLELEATTRNNLDFISEHRNFVGGALRKKVGSAVMESLAENSICFQGRPPKTSQEYLAVPALAILNALVDDSGESSTSFESKIGWETLLALRHLSDAHFWEDAASLVQNGLTAACVAKVVRDAASELGNATGSRFKINREGRLRLRLS
jgi:hypothetical protein